ncbi:MAG: hypothetical protein BMS9Abin07_0542 [Acidimicrobiia bacterium]|nr:MAG: hypothetical protein BMS9Abin07_0542 [Acidimicrobiia bacterium]
MRTARPMLVKLALLIAVALVASACAGAKQGHDEDGWDFTPAAVEDVASAPTDAEAEEVVDADGVIVVSVTLTDFAIDMSRTDFEAGVSYRFVVTNDGSVPHELMFSSPVEPGAMDMEEMDEMAIAVFSDEDLAAGATAEQTFSFPVAGEAGLESACHLPGHYEAGMMMPIVVTS